MYSSGTRSIAPHPKSNGFKAEIEVPDSLVRSSLIDYVRGTSSFKAIMLSNLLSSIPLAPEDKFFLAALGNEQCKLPTKELDSGAKSAISSSGITISSSTTVLAWP